MCYANNEKRKTTERMELLNQRKIRTFGEKENLQILRNIGSGHHQTSGDERKIFLNTSEERGN